MATKTSLLGLTKPAYTEAADIAVLNTNFDLIDKAVGQGARVQNLLDNSYFPSAYVINQRGATNYSGSWARCIDRWICVTPGDSKFWSNPTNVGVPAGGRIVQCLNVKAADVVGKTYTLAFANTTGTVYVGSGTVKAPTDTTLYHIAQDNNGVIVWLYSVAADGYLYAVLYNNTSYNVPLVWAALYEGAYTADTLPAYVYKGYAAELAECMRYYRTIKGGRWTYCASSGTTRYFCGNYVFGIPMRATPTFTFTSATAQDIGTVENVQVYSGNATGLFQLSCTSETTPGAGKWLGVSGYASADL